MMAARQRLQARPAPIAPLPPRRGPPSDRFRWPEVSDFRRPLTGIGPKRGRHGAAGERRLDASASRGDLWRPKMRFSK